LKRIEAGLDLLEKDEKAAQAFQFMNRAMWLQRTHSMGSGSAIRTAGDPAKSADARLPGCDR